MSEHERGRSKSLDGLIKRAGQSLDEGACFEAERVAEKAVAAARTHADWAAMIDAVDLLQAARTQRRDPSLVKGAVRILDEPGEEDDVLEPGRWLIQPPLVGAVARRLRLNSLAKDIPVLVLCREPTTQLGLIPLVAIAPGTTVRVQVKPPSNERKPTAAWFKSGMAALGDAALDRIDGGLELERRIDALLGALDAVPDHDGICDLLVETCRTALNEQA